MCILPRVETGVVADSQAIYGSHAVHDPAGVRPRCSGAVVG